MHWRRKWQPTPVFLPGESQGQGSLVGCRLWGHTESDMTEVDLAAAAALFINMRAMGIHLPGSTKEIVSLKHNLVVNTVTS